MIRKIRQKLIKTRMPKFGEEIVLVSSKDRRKRQRAIITTVDVDGFTMETEYGLFACLKDKDHSVVYFLKNKKYKSW